MKEAKGTRQAQGGAARSKLPKRHRIPGWPMAAAAAVLFAFLYYVRVVLLPFVIAAALGFILSPGINWLQARLRPLPRWVVALAVYIVLLAVFGGVGYWAVPVIIGDVGDLASHAPDLIDRVIRGALPSGQLAFLGQTSSADALVQNALAALRNFLTGGAGLALASGSVAAVFGVFLTLVLLAYFLVSGPGLARGILWLVPPEHRDEVRRLGITLAPILRRYFIGLIVIVLYASVLSWIVFTLFHVAHAPLLAVTVGLLELIPVLGPVVSIMLICLAAVQQSGFLLMLSLAALAPLLRLSIDQLIGPYVLGRASYLHPVAVIFAFFSGAVFLGVLGLILAVPVAATLKIVLQHYYEEQIEPEDEAR
ncbi:MAG TPA: AI-2E family transporter [Stellaceae bacterium]|nr:AI-2E family transporter [Stellaceae bacterium]